MEEVAFDGLNSRAGSMRKRTITPGTQSAHTPRCIQAPGVPRETLVAWDSWHMGVAEEVLVVSLTCLKYMRRQEDWPHCDEQVRAGNGSLGRRLRQLK